MGLAPAMLIYLREVNQQEPAIISRYEGTIPEVKRALAAIKARCRLLPRPLSLQPFVGGLTNPTFANRV